MNVQKVCLCTFDFPGPIGNGGIGTAFRALAEELVAAGHQVTVLYPSAYTENLPVSHWIDYWRERGVEMVSLFVEGPAKLHGYEAYHWLKTRHFDVIHYHDWKGPGYWLTVAKRCGLAFRNTTLVCQAHGQSFWHLEHSGQFMSDPAELEIDWTEQRSVEGADVLYSPSAYFIDYMEKRGWQLPARRFVTPNLLPATFEPGREADGGKVPVDELVFFGRLETRKGLEIFCAAVTRLIQRGVRPRRIAFLGKVGEVAGGNALAHITEASAGWGVPWMVRNNLDTDGAKQFLAQPGRLAVIASLIENSPYTVLECLAAGQAFIASDVGGVRELLHADDQPATVYALNAAAMADAMQRALTEGAVRARPAIGLAENRARWSTWHAGLTPEPLPAPAVVDATPLVSICMATHNRPVQLAQALRSIEAQSYPRIELVLVDDASPLPEAQAYLRTLEADFAARGWKLLRNETNLYTGRTRNRAVSAASGDFVLLMDDDNAAFPHEVETLVRAAQASGADVVTCQPQPFSGGGEPPRHVARFPLGWMPIGPNLSLGMLENCLGDLNMLLRRDVWNTLGGFSEDRTGNEDWEFLMRAGLAGYHLECLPEILFSYRVWNTSNSRRQTRKNLYDGFQRVDRHALETVPPALRMAVRFGLEAHFAAAERRGEGYWSLHVNPDPGLREIAHSSLLGIDGLVAAANHVTERGDRETGLMLLRQALAIAPSAPRVALELIGREEDSVPLPLESHWVEAVISGLAEDELPRAGLALGRLITRGERGSAEMMAEAIVRRFPGSEQGRFLLAMARS
jgi:glycosyltransferase involved in cell wall biosynthesis